MIYVKKMIVVHWSVCYGCYVTRFATDDTELYVVTTFESTKPSTNTLEITNTKTSGILL